jgi:hypothetical protein
VKINIIVLMAGDVPPDVWSRVGAHLSFDERNSCITTCKNIIGIHYENEIGKFRSHGFENVTSFEHDLHMFCRWHKRFKPKLSDIDIIFCGEDEMSSVRSHVCNDIIAWTNEIGIDIKLYRMEIHQLRREHIESIIRVFPNSTFKRVFIQDSRFDPEIMQTFVSNFCDCDFTLYITSVNYLPNSSLDQDVFYSLLTHVTMQVRDGIGSRIIDLSKLDVNKVSEVRIYTNLDYVIVCPQKVTHLYVYPPEVFTMYRDHPLRLLNDETRKTLRLVELGLYDTSPTSANGIMLLLRIISSSTVVMMLVTSYVGFAIMVEVQMLVDGPVEILTTHDGNSIPWLLHHLMVCLDCPRVRLVTLMSDGTRVTNTHMPYDSLESAYLALEPPTIMWAFVRLLI